MSVETDDEELSAVEVHHSPATVSSVIASVAAVVAVLSSGGSILGMAIGIFGLIPLLGGLYVLESEGSFLLGVGIVFVGVVSSGAFGDGSLPLLVMGAFASILAFDVGTNAFSVGRQLSDETDTVRGEAVHVAASVAAGVVIVGLAVGIFAAGLEGLSMGALAFLLFGGLLLVWSIRS